MNTITVEATLELALSCARSFGAAVTRAACDAIAERAALEELARAPLALASADGQLDLAASVRAGFAHLADIDPVVLSPADRVRFLKAAVAHVAWAESRVNAAMLAIAGVTRRIHAVQVGIEGTRAERIEIEDAARSEIALAARWSEAQAQQRLESARLLHHLLPETATALADGSVSLAHATVIAEGAARLAVGAGVDVTHSGTDRDGDVWLALTDAAAQLDRRASVIAARSTRSHTRAAVTRIVDSLDPDGMRARRERAVANRDVWIESEQDGSALLVARMRAADAHGCLNRIRERAARVRELAMVAGEPDARRIGELRALALTDLVLGACEGYATGVATQASSHAPDPDGSQSGVMTSLPAGRGMPLRADIQVVISLDALLGLQDLGGSHDIAIVRGTTGDDELVPAAEIRELLSDAHCDVTLRRLVADPLTGHLLDVSPGRYKPSERLRDFIATRDARCRWPGCNQRATESDVDHAEPFDNGGSTTRANLGVLCRRHHLLKTHEGYGITESDNTGACTITTPAGETYPHEPSQVLPNDDPPRF